MQLSSFVNSLSSRSPHEILAVSKALFLKPLEWTFVCFGRCEHEVCLWFVCYHQSQTLHTSIDWYAVSVSQTRTTYYKLYRVMSLIHIHVSYTIRKNKPSRITKCVHRKITRTLFTALRCICFSFKAICIERCLLEIGILPSNGKSKKICRTVDDPGIRKIKLIIYYLNR